MKTRYYPIDFLKAISILVIIVLHYLSYSLSDKFLFNLWNWLHFVVTAFVFAAGYLFADQVNAKKFSNPLGYLKKKVVKVDIAVLLFSCFKVCLNISCSVLVFWYWFAKNI
ncbi:MAG: hypothetical protein KatS3mg090_0199 [Patescibacteria group bacterium]|nr:MAG: hypothetical protein KatS3mg090_0199 [Patescibacteria group bacterium]